MAALDDTRLEGALKRQYVQPYVDNLAPDVYPFAQLVRKETSRRFGQGIVVAVPYAGSAARSADFDQSKTKADAGGQIAQFILTPVTDYNIAEVHGLTVRNASNSSQIWDPLTKDIDTKFEGLHRAMGHAIYKSGWGSVGTVDTDVSGTTLTLNEPEAVMELEVGMELQFSESESGHVLRDSGEALTISAINYDSGAITVAADLNTIASLTDGDHVFIKGDRENSATPTRKRPAGFLAWIPTSAASSTAFFGVNRSVSSRLYGNRQAYVTSVVNTIIQASMKVYRAGGRASHLFVNPLKYGDILNTLEGTKDRATDVTKAGISYEGVVVHTPTGAIKVMPDAGCPNTIGALVDLKSWVCYSNGSMPGFLGMDKTGGKIVQLTDKDGIQAKIGGDYNFACEAPSHNCVITSWS